MSTTEESAKLWIQDKAPSVGEIQAVIDKLEARIEGWKGDEETIQGSIAAAIYLQSYLEENDIASQPSSDPETTVSDPTNLIPDSQPIEIEREVKLATFEALKKQLGKILKD